MTNKICISKRTFILIIFIFFLISIFVLYQNSTNTILGNKLSYNSRASQPDSIQPKTVNPIMNGGIAEKNWYPFYTKIIKANGGVCGGSLISDSYVLTAAHCVYDEWKNGGTLKILIGVNDYSGDYLGQYAGVVEHTATNKNIFPHERYTPSEKDIDQYSDLVRTTYDIALIRLKVRAIGVPTISYPSSSSNTDNYPEVKYVGSKSTVVGVGLLHVGDTNISGKLLDAKIAISDYVARPKSNIVLVSEENGGAVTLYGDSGGPSLLFYNNKPYLIGVIWTFQPAWRSSFLTSTSYFSDWIANTSQVLSNSGTVNKNIGDISSFPPQVPVCSTIRSYGDCSMFSTMCMWNGNSCGVKK